MKNIKMTPEMLEMIKKYSAESIANEIVNIQPMDGSLIRDLLNSSMSESELISQGYEPIDSQTKLSWKKKND